MPRADRLHQHQFGVTLGTPLSPDKVFLFANWEGQRRELTNRFSRVVLDNIDAIIKLIRASRDVDTARTGLMKKFKLSEIQAKAILDMRLQRLTQLERHKIVEEHEQTLALIADLKGILASESRLLGIIKAELAALKEEFGDARRTEILAETVDLTIEDLLADEDMVVTITRSGYIKRTHVEAYRSQKRGGKGVTGMETKEEDIVEDLFVASTHAYLLFPQQDAARLQVTIRFSHPLKTIVLVREMVQQPEEQNPLHRCGVPGKRTGVADARAGARTRRAHVRTARPRVR